MTSKTVAINPSPRSKPPQPSVSALDSFVSGGNAGARKAEPKVEMKRLTFDIDAALHKRIRRTCLDRDIDMAVELRRILSEHFPQ
jgi:hypothetical protein